MIGLPLKYAETGSDPSILGSEAEKNPLPFLVIHEMGLSRKKESQNWTCILFWKKGNPDHIASAERKFRNFALGILTLGNQ